MCSDVSLKPVSVAVLVVTAPVWVESNSSCNCSGSEAEGDELLMRGGETTSLRMATIEEGETDEGGKREKTMEAVENGNR